MSEMTLGEAVRVLSSATDQMLSTEDRGRATDALLDHAERTLAAREGEPYVLRELHDDMRRNQDRLWASSHLDPLVAHIDTLTAQLAEAKASRIERESIAATALKDRLILTAQLAEARRERDNLAAIVQRVRRVAPCDHNPVADWVYYDDILDALTPEKT